MVGRLICKLEQFTKLSTDDMEALSKAASTKRRTMRPREDIIREGDRPKHVNLILDGWACHYKMLQDGRRQITSFLMAGDICDLRLFILNAMDHSIGALTPVTVAEIPSSTIAALIESHPRLARAFWWASLVEEAILREWITSLGQRQAMERLAHLLCELFIRLRGVGLTNGASCDLPLTQEQLGDATGMSLIHVSRTLRELRESGLIALTTRTLTIPDLQGLMDVALFNVNYLHLDGDGPRRAADNS
jgi:CRP-like cAMP-binding protein